MGNSQGKPVAPTDEVNLNHFRLLRVVGKGAFGKVRIVEQKDTGDTFALKYIRKDEIVRQESVRNIIRERRMLEHLNHPFLCNLRYSFQDMEYLYLVVDLMSGGDLRFHISRKAFTEDCVRFWMAELACALRYIHKQGIVHRDVKPDNVLLDSDGHVHLADFNVASDFRAGKLLTSKSGTLAYLAPEAFRGPGYLCEVDWWSLGVTFYECIYGKRPFEAKHQDELAEAICAAKPRFWVTKPPVMQTCMDAMSRLMERDKKKRIGAAGWETFTNDPFFKPINFEMLERKQIPPVFIPSSEKTNFDATYDLEELLLEEAPLEARARKQKPRAELRQDATSREIREDELHRMIETMFKPFDYTQADYEGTAADAVAGTVPEEHVELKVNAPSASPRKSSSSPSPDGSPPASPSLSPAKPQPQPQLQPQADYRPSPLAPTRSQPQQPPSSMDCRPSPLSPVKSSPQQRQNVEDQSESHHHLLHHHNPNHHHRFHHLPGILTAKDVINSAVGQGLTPQQQQQQQQPPSSQPPSQQQQPASSAVSFSRPLQAQRPSAGKRQTSQGGGIRMVLEENGTGSWSGLADQSTAPPPDSGERGKESSSVLGFLGRKKGRDRSPKPKEPGVLGKIGSRHIIN